MKIYGRVKNGKLISSLNEKSLNIFEGEEVEIRIRIRINKTDDKWLKEFLKNQEVLLLTDLK
jgi:predicted DNA-binding antitoxin AbrB/MazE fold protein